MIHVLPVNLLDFNGVVAQEEVQGVELVSTIVCGVLPQDLKAQDTTIVVEEALKTTVRSATL